MRLKSLPRLILGAVFVALFLAWLVLHDKPPLDRWPFPQTSLSWAFLAIAVALLVRGVWLLVTAFRLDGREPSHDRPDLPVLRDLTPEDPVGLKGFEGSAAVVVGAQSGLGLGVATVLAEDGWRVVAVTDADESVELARLAETVDGRVEVQLGVPKDRSTLSSLTGRYRGANLDLLYVSPEVSSSWLSIKEQSERFSEEQQQTDQRKSLDDGQWAGAVVSGFDGALDPGAVIAVVPARTRSEIPTSGGLLDPYAALISSSDFSLKQYMKVRKPHRPRLALFHIIPSWPPVEAPQAAELARKLLALLQERRQDPGFHRIDQDGRDVKARPNYPKG